MNVKLKSFIAFMLFNIMVTNSVIAQATESVVEKPGIPDILYNPSFYLVSFLFLIMLIVIAVLSRVIKTITNSQFAQATAKEKVISKEEIIELEKESLWSVFDRKFLTKAVPIEKEQDIMLDHDYDGIKELDNNLPPWWKWGFYFTIIFSVIYLFHYHVLATGKLQKQEYISEVASAEAAQQERMLKMADMVTEETATVLNTSDAIASGKEVFTKNCVACHGQNLEGGVGPNLTDQYWIHGGGIKNIFKTIKVGVTEKGMISWKSQLSPKQIQEVSSYIISKIGSNPTNPKAPQGPIWQDPTTNNVDSLNTPQDSTITASSEKIK